MKIEIVRSGPIATDIFALRLPATGLAISAWRTVKPEPTSNEKDKPLLRDCNLEWPHNRIGNFAKATLRSLGIRVRGELEDRAKIPGYGQPDLYDKFLLNLVECGSTDEGKLSWCLWNGATFWWAGMSVGYEEWRSGSRPALATFFLVRFRGGRPGRFKLSKNGLYLALASKSP